MRFKMRLAFGLGRTVRELEESLGSDEWDDWLLFHRLYDLPDGFLVTGQLGTLVSRGLWGKGVAGDYAPYYEPPPRPAPHGPPPELAGFVAFVKQHGTKRDRQLKDSPNGRTA